LETFCDNVGIANNAKDMMGHLKKTLTDKAKHVDQNYFNIPDFVITGLWPFLLSHIKIFESGSCQRY